MSDEFALDTPFVRDLVAEVRLRIAGAADPAAACAAVEPLFRDLLGDREWLPAEYQRYYGKAMGNPGLEAKFRQAQALTFLQSGRTGDPDGRAGVFEPLRGDLLERLNF